MTTRCHIPCQIRSVEERPYGAFTRPDGSSGEPGVSYRLIAIDTDDNKCSLKVKQGEAMAFAGMIGQNVVIIADFIEQPRGGGRLEIVGLAPKAAAQPKAA